MQDKNLLMSRRDSVVHEIRVDPDDENAVMRVWVRDLTFLDLQEAATTMVKMSGDDLEFDLQGYWRHAFTHWVTKTEPQLSADELCNLKGYVGQQLAAVLPNPNQLAEALQGGFTNGASAASKIS